MGYEEMLILGTRVYISGVRGHAYPGYEGMHIRGTRYEGGLCKSGVEGRVTLPLTKFRRYYFPLF